MLLDYIIYFSHGKGNILVCCQDINSLIKMKVANERLGDVFFKGGRGNSNQCENSHKSDIDEIIKV